MQVYRPWKKVTLSTNQNQKSKAMKQSLGLQVLPPIDDVVAASPSSLTHEPQEQVLDSVESCISLPPNRDQAFAGKDGDVFFS